MAITNGINAGLSLCGRNTHETTNNMAIMAVAKKYLRVKLLRCLHNRKNVITMCVGNAQMMFRLWTVLVWSVKIHRKVTSKPTSPTTKKSAKSKTLEPFRRYENRKASASIRQQTTVGVMSPGGWKAG